MMRPDSEKLRGGGGGAGDGAMRTRATRGKLRSVNISQEVVTI
jgi:hypothetical protein